MKKSADHRENIIDILKGICICFVCITHFSWQSDERKSLLFPWWIDMAVPAFMILSGYVYERSINRKNIVGLSQAYSVSGLVSKAIRFTIPVLLVYLGILAWDQHKYGKIPYEIFNTFLRGGRGQGAYYYPVMMQTIFVLPVIGILIKRYEDKGLLLCLGINIVCEILHVAYYIPTASYRLLMFRYIFPLAAGCYIALEKKIPVAGAVAMFCIGAVFIWRNAYTDYKPTYLIHWTQTSCIASMYIIPVVCLLIRKCRLRFAPLELLGRASYNIFLIQMLYYYSVAEIVYANVESRKLQLLISVSVCLLAGVLYYYLETPLTKWVQRKTVKLLTE